MGRQYQRKFNKHFLTALACVIGVCFLTETASAQIGSQQAPKNDPDYAFRFKPYRDHYEHEWGTEELRKNIRKDFEEGVEALKEGDYEKAELRFDKVLAIADRHPQANFFMAIAKLGQDKKKAAKSYLLTAIRAKSDYIEARETLGLLMVELDNSLKAQKQLEALQKMKAKCDSKGCENDFVERLEVAISRLQAALA